MFCIHCGNPNGSGAKFCAHCGQEVTAQPVSPPLASVSPAEPVSQPSQRPPNLVSTSGEPIPTASSVPINPPRVSSSRPAVIITTRPSNDPVVPGWLWAATVLIAIVSLGWAISIATDTRISGLYSGSGMSFSFQGDGNLTCQGEGYPPVAATYHQTGQQIIAAANNNNGQPVSFVFTLSSDGTSITDSATGMTFHKNDLFVADGATPRTRLGQTVFHSFPWLWPLVVGGIAITVLFRIWKRTLLNREAGP